MGLAAPHFITACSCCCCCCCCCCGGGGDGGGGPLLHGAMQVGTPHSTPPPHVPGHYPPTPPPHHPPHTHHTPANCFVADAEWCCERQASLRGRQERLRIRLRHRPPGLHRAGGLPENQGEEGEGLLGSGRVGCHTIDGLISRSGGSGAAAAPAWVGGGLPGIQDQEGEAVSAPAVWGWVGLGGWVGNGGGERWAPGKPSRQAGGRQVGQACRWGCVCVCVGGGVRHVAVTPRTPAGAAVLLCVWGGCGSCTMHPQARWLGIVGGGGPPAAACCSQPGTVLSDWQGSAGR